MDFDPRWGDDPRDRDDRDRELSPGSRGGSNPREREALDPRDVFTITPLLCPGATPGEMWAADERGVHRSDDSGKSWRRVVGYATPPQHLRGLALVQ